MKRATTASPGRGGHADLRLSGEHPVSHSLTAVWPHSPHMLPLHLGPPPLTALADWPPPSEHTRPPGTKYPSRDIADCRCCSRSARGTEPQNVAFGSQVPSASARASLK